MKTGKKRLLSLILALVMVLSVFPMTVFADDEAEPTEPTEAVEGIVEEVAEEEIIEEEISEEVEPLEELLTEETEPEEEYTESAPAMNESTSFTMTNGSTNLKLTADSALSESVTITSNTTLDLNGHSLDLGENTITVTGGTLTIKNYTNYSTNPASRSDGTITGTNGITVSGGTLSLYGNYAYKLNDYYHNYVVVACPLTVTGGTVKVGNGGNKWQDAKITGSMNVSGNGNLTVGDSSIICGGLTFDSTGTFTCNGALSGEKVTLKNGTVNLNVTYPADDELSAPIDIAGAAVTLSKGNIESAVTVTSGSLAVSGGTVSGAVALNGGEMSVASGTVSGDITVNGGSLTVSGGTVSGAITKTDGTVAITGGRFANDPSALLDIGHGAVKESDTSYCVLPKSADGLTVPAGTTLTLANGVSVEGGIVNNGTLVMQSGSSVTGGVTNSGTLTIKTGASVTGNVASSAGSLTVEADATLGGTLTVTGGAAQILGAYTVTGDAAFTSGVSKLESGASVTGNVTNSATLNLMPGSKVEGDVSSSAGVLNINKDAVVTGTVSVTGGAVSLGDGITLTGDVAITSGSSRLYSGSKIEGNVTASGTASLIVEEGAEITGTVTGFAAQVGTQYYNSLSSAISGAFTGDTVKLLKDETLSSSISINSKTFTLDLNGQTITCKDYSSNISIGQSSNVTIKDGSEEKDGKISHTGGSYALFINGSAKVTIESGIFEETSGNYFVQTNAAAVQLDIKGGTFSIKGAAKFLYENGGGTINVYDCTVNTVEPATGFAMIGARASSSITFYGGTFNTGNRQFVETNQTVSVQGGLYDQDVTAYCAMGKTCVDDTDHEGYYKIVARTADDSTLYLERKDGTQLFGDSIKNAMAEAQDGDSVVLLQDLEFDDTIYTYAKNVTLNLNNHTLGKGDWVNGQISLKEDMTIKNGTIVCDTTGESSAIEAWYSANSAPYEKTINLTLDNVTVISKHWNTPLVVDADGTSRVCTMNLILTLAPGSHNVLRSEGNNEPAIRVGESRRTGTANLTITGTGELVLEGSTAIDVVETTDMNGRSFSKSSLTIDNPNVKLKATSSYAMITSEADINENTVIDMSCWGMIGMESATGKKCPQYLPITDDTEYRDTAVAEGHAEAWVSAKYLYDNYYSFAEGHTRAGKNLYNSAVSFQGSALWGEFVPGWYSAPSKISKFSIPLTISAGKFYGSMDAMYMPNGFGTSYTPADDEDLFEGSVLSGGQYAYKPASKYIVDGYEAVRYSDEAYPELHWEIVKIKQVDAGTAKVSDGEGGNKTITIETHGDDKSISATKKGTTEAIATEAVATLITETLNNDAVSEFSGTKIDAGTDNGLIKEELKKDSKVESDDTAKANIDATTNILKQITVDLTATTVEVQQDSTSVKEINSMTFEVKPIARTTVVDGEGNEKTVEVVIPNELITAPLTFRLFVATTDAKEAAVYHKGSEDGAKKEYIGLYPIEKDATTGKYFIELSAQEFSEYTYETVHVTEGAAAVIPDGNGSFNGYNTLAEAIAAVEDGQTIILMKDFTETEAINFASTTDKAYELDLNGHVLTGTGTNAEYVTVSNNDTAKPDCLAVIGVFANNVKAFVADGYDARTSTPAIESVTNNEVFSNNATDVFTVKVVTSTDIDRDTTNDEEVKNVDVFAGDHVYAEVRIYGARSVAAKVALKYDDDNLTIYDYPNGWNDDDNDGIIKFYDANTDGITYWVPTLHEDDEEPYYVLGEFDFTVDEVEESKLADLAGDNKDVNGNPVLKDMFEIVGDTYVAGAWKAGWSSIPANKVQTSKIFNDWANIRLKQMSVAVTPMTGLVYKNTALQLFKNTTMEGVDKDFSATDKNTLAEVTGAEITYAVLTKAEADGTLNPDYDPSVVGSQQYTIEPQTPTSYNLQYPTKTVAGEYVVFYKVTKPGYVTVTGKENVKIDPYPVTINWKATDLNKGSAVKNEENASFWVASDFNASYENKVFTAPTATYIDADGTSVAAVVAMTNPAGGTLKAVGSYVYTATVDSNYVITENPTCTVFIDGGKIKGYTLQNADANNDGNINAADESVFVDKQQHDAADLDIANDATPATVKYYLSSDDGKNYGNALDAMPTVTEVGKYAVKVVISADGYYDDTQIVKFEIKRVEFFTEKTEYVLGWKLILAYTNEEVPGFTYNGHYMYDVSTLDYKYLEQKNDLGTETTVAGTEYSHVYAILVEGFGDETLVVPSNDPTSTHTIYPKNGAPNRLDVNENGDCDINDLVAVQAVYNVDTIRYLNDEMMHIALKADVTGNKMVNMADYQKIKSVS